METTKRIYAPHELMPAIPIHPGEMIKDELQARGISQKKFAEIIGVSPTVLNEVLNGKQACNDRICIENRGGNGYSGLYLDQYAIRLQHADRPP